VNKIHWRLLVQLESAAEREARAVETEEAFRGLYHPKILAGIETKHQKSHHPSRFLDFPTPLETVYVIVRRHEY
jgi:hypothetical protein